jgi:phage tail tape-measure protein
MAGARIIGSWRDPASNTIWSIAELDMKYVKSTMAGVADMNGDLKRYIETSADNIFDHLSKEKK